MEVISTVLEFTAAAVILVTAGVKMYQDLLSPIGGDRRNRD